MVQKLSDIEIVSVDIYASTGDSCPELRTRYDVDVREFVVLSCIKDKAAETRRGLSALVGLSPTTVNDCVTKLRNNGLVRRAYQGLGSLSVTPEGLALLRKANRESDVE